MLQLPFQLSLSSEDMSEETIQKDNYVLKAIFQ